MKLATLDAGADGHPGILVTDDEVLDLVAARPYIAAAATIPASVRDILEQGEAALNAIQVCAEAFAAMDGQAQAQLRETQALVPFETCTLRGPVPDPRIILSAGLNYGRHLAEMDNSPKLENPIAFLKVPGSLTGSRTPIVIPPGHSEMVDFEGEFSFVFGRRCHQITVEDAMDYVAGYTIANDVSARDWVGEVFSATASFEGIQAWERNIMGKNFPTFTPCGPVLVTKDEIADPHDLQLTTRLNGEVIQSTKTDDLIFKIPDIIAYYSQWYCFQPGDIVTTGSPSGVGVARDPRVFMHEGDTIEIEVEGIGVLSNYLVPQ